MPAELHQKVNKLLDEFGALVQGISQERHLPRAVVRRLLSCSLVGGFRFRQSLYPCAASLRDNMMYELGIAHTVGKETILIYQRGRGKDPKFPFDLSHIRRIEYEDSASGGKKLEIDLSATLESILKPAAIS